MDSLLRIFQAITPDAPYLPTQHDREASYLAAATDIADLERRMRAIEQPHAGLSPALGLR